MLDADGNVSEYVTRAGLQEESGWVRIFVYSSQGTPSAALLADGQTRIDGTRDDAAGTITPGVRSAGVRVDVLAMSERAVGGAFQVGMAPGASLTPAVEQALQDVFDAAVVALEPGQTLYLGTLVELMLSVTGVRTVVPLLSSNIECAPNEALIPGAFYVTAL